VSATHSRRPQWRDTDPARDVTETRPAADVPVSDPGRAAFALREELRETFDRVAASGWYVHGREHAAFESEFATFLGTRHCLGLASGTDALQLALLAVGCSAGDEILTSANCGGYTTAAARSAGLRVRFADVDADTLGLSPATVEQALRPATRAVVVTHLYGLVGDIEGVAELCRERGAALVEDCAQATGARVGARRAGTFGDAAAFSFYPTKNLAALGDGGAVTTNSEDIADRVRRLRQYGWEPKYRVTLDGGRNSRLDELQAAILRPRLGRLDEANARRRAIVERYAEALPPNVGRFVRGGGGEDFVAHLAVVVAGDRPALRQALEAAGVGTDVHYPIPDHRQPAWSGDYRSVQLPVTEHAAEHVLTLPCFPELRDEEVERACEVLRAL
jgi:dTDP-3-amino-2,3,6-trideoxy-4-keto-D-glucose/dTDP-3-amino-3,4,6-trideoxy-alpha-D-glucose/dTDP-2,6-dideoxy-D-kanosamine transaminase